MIAPWHEYVANLHALWVWLENRGDQPDDPAYFLEKPWKWEPEWNQMQRERVGA